MAEYPHVERRSGHDRRKRPRSLIESVLFKGSRLSTRRAEDRKKIIAFDRYRPSLLIKILIVLSLSLLDAFLTLILLSKGAIELNPVMDYYLRYGPTQFIVVKYALTVFSLLLIVLLNDVFKTRYGVGTGAFLYLYTAIFGSVVIWQFSLLSV